MFESVLEQTGSVMDRTKSAGHHSNNKKKKVVKQRDTGQREAKSEETEI